MHFAELFMQSLESWLDSVPVCHQPHQPAFPHPPHHTRLGRGSLDGSHKTNPPSTLHNLKHGPTQNILSRFIPGVCLYLGYKQSVWPCSPPSVFVLSCHLPIPVHHPALLFPSCPFGLCQERALSLLPLCNLQHTKSYELHQISTKGTLTRTEGLQKPR